MPRIGISLGSNLGDRLANLTEAVRRLKALRSSSHLLVSTVFETDPVGCPPDSPAFYNAIIEFETDLSPLILLEETQRIEQSMGREEIREKNAPRPIDLDLLYYGDLHITNPDLEIPHPRMMEREFVLRPLREIRPELISESMLEDAVDPECQVRPVETPIKIH